MFKFIAVFFFALPVLQVAAQDFIPVGGLCSGIGGPLPTPCEPGSTCCQIGPDLAKCTSGTICFIPEGGLCSGIAGPIPKPCMPGTTCCSLGPDNSVCSSSCKKSY